MKIIIQIIVFSSIIIISGCSKKVTINCKINNYMSDINTNKSNKYETRRELKTTFSESDFNSKLNDYEISCSEILVKYLYCNICFNSDENSLTSYNGQVFNLINTKSADEITDECIKLISSMSMGSKEFYEFIQSQK